MSTELINEEPQEVKEETEVVAPPTTEVETIEIDTKEEEQKLEVAIPGSPVPSHYNDDVYKDRHCDDDELRYQMIQRPVENDLEKHLYDYCDGNLETRYRYVIRDNKILPMETTKKSITLKLRKNTPKERKHIAETIDKTFATYYPEKILTFINSTVQLLFLERMRDMEREFTCVHGGTFYHIYANTQYTHKKFFRSFSTVRLDIITSRFE